MRNLDRIAFAMNKIRSVVHFLNAAQNNFALVKETRSRENTIVRIFAESM
jgi:hypothetical protein